MAESRRQTEADAAPLLLSDPLWYKDAVIYQLHIKAFCDSNGDGIGDFPGLTGKLDYLQELGITAIWLLPFYPSPLRDDGYDIADYNDIHPSYGTMADFKVFLREAHRRGLRVITELVCNHTSDQHPWFQRARRAKPGSSARDFYVWSDTTERYRDARIIFKDFETSNWTWDAVAGAYFWHRFYSHQPDLNFENPAVHRAIIKAMDFWFDLGVDGMRLDAIPYLYEQEGTNCENLAPTHAFLKKLRRHVDTRYPGRMLLAEACQWPEDTVTYFGEGDGDECHMAFHFPVMPRLYMAVQQEDRFPIIDILRQTPQIPATSQWAMFLRNHDELTLEMVTDEERDYMWRAYAADPQARINLGIRRRLAPLLGNHRRKIELMNGLLFALPGTPIVYYGDEIGMGDNYYLGDRNGVRTPMQWNGDRNAGFSRANPQRLYLPLISDSNYHYESLNVENQLANQHSLLWWMRRLIALRKRYEAFGRGTLEFLQPDNRKVLCFIRRSDDQMLLVVANLSRFVQGVSVDLSAYRGLMPVELFGQVEMPVISEQPYFLTLGPHSFYWFKLEPPRPDGLLSGQPEPDLALLKVDAGSWDAVFYDGRSAQLERMLPTYLNARRWFGGKARRIKRCNIEDFFRLDHQAGPYYLTLIAVEYADGATEHYVLPMAYSDGEAADQLRQEQRHSVIAELQISGRSAGLLYDPIVEKRFTTALLEFILGRRRLQSKHGAVLTAGTTRALRTLLTGSDNLEPQLLRGEQSNSSINYGQRLMLKLFRKTADGRNPDLELGRYLTEEAGFLHTPPTAGWLEIVRGNDEPLTLAIVQGYVANEGLAFAYALDDLQRFLDSVTTRPDLIPPVIDGSTAALLAAVDQPAPEVAREFFSVYLESARLLGRRTAEMHHALAAGRTPGLIAEEFSSLYQRSIYQSARSLTIQTLQQLRSRSSSLPETAQAAANRLLAAEDQLLTRLGRIIGAKIATQRIRTHGDYHLEQVLFTGNDYQIIDFEGEPLRPISERRIKRSALRDVAGLLRSYQYVAQSALSRRPVPEQGTRMRAWADYWAFYVSAAFLNGYFADIHPPIVPQDPAERRLLLELYVIEKAVYELKYEMNNRPDWVMIPLQGILAQLDAFTAAAQTGGTDD